MSPMEDIEEVGPGIGAGGEALPPEGSSGGEGLPSEDEQRIAVEAMLALEGRHPDPKAALEEFVEVFGGEALQELRAMMQQGEGAGVEAGAPAPGGEAPLPEEQEPLPSLGEEEEPEGVQVDLAAAGGGLLNGPGSGQSDEIEGSTPSGRPVLLSDGEYVIDAPTVAALGDGSTNAGARRLDEFRKQVRQQAYGHDKQAKPMKKGSGGIVVKLGG